MYYFVCLFVFSFIKLGPHYFSTYLMGASKLEVDEWILPILKCYFVQIN